MLSDRFPDISIPDISKDPDSLKKMSYAKVEKLCADIRKVLIDTASRNGGHLAPNFGVVELTVAIHRVFSAPTSSSGKKNIPTP